jgi:hypothetical protein
VHLLETFIRNLIEDARYRKPQVPRREGLDVMAVNLVREKDVHRVCFHCLRKDVTTPTVTNSPLLMRSRAGTVEKPCGALV